MAENKSESWKALLTHTGIYSTGLMLTIFFFSLYNGNPEYLKSLYFGLITFVTHTVIDAVTSTYSAKAYKKEKYRTFFNIIGFDQLLHIAQIVLTYTLL
jgi:hypothetical protein